MLRYVRRYIGVSTLGNEVASVVAFALPMTVCRRWPGNSCGGDIAVERSAGPEDSLTELDDQIVTVLYHGMDRRPLL